MVKPASKKELVKKMGDYYLVWVKEPPKENRANEAVISAMSKYLRVPKSQVRIVTGNAFRQKILEIPLTAEQLQRFEKSKKIQPGLFED